MAAKPKSMHQIKHIIELQLQGKSIRQTERLTGVARNTIREYLRKIKSQTLSFEQLLMLDDESLGPSLAQGTVFISKFISSKYFKFALTERGPRAIRCTMSILSSAA